MLILSIALSQEGSPAVMKGAEAVVSAVLRATAIQSSLPAGNTARSGKIMASYEGICSGAAISKPSASASDARTAGKSRGPGGMRHSKITASAAHPSIPRVFVLAEGILPAQQTGGLVPHHIRVLTRRQPGGRG